MQKEKLDVTVSKKLQATISEAPKMTEWKEFLKKLKNPKKEVTIGLVGKYVELPDAYKSIIESFIHAGSRNECKVNLRLIHSEDINETNFEEILAPLEGILVAPGFGERGIEGKILAVKYAREKNKPFFGICLGMQVAVVEFARNVLGLTNAHSTEMVRSTPYPVIDLMEQQKGVTEKGGTMRLGAYPCIIKEKTKVFNAYGKVETSERHRHRYEFNNDYLGDFEKAGMIAAGINPDNNLVEIMENTKHPWFIGVQFHPEYSSNVLNPHPLFVDFVKAVIHYSESGK
jgi:CTP synthase